MKKASCKSAAAAAMLAVAMFATACTDNKEDNNGGGKDPSEAPFTISVNNISATSAEVEVAPQSDDCTYYFDVLKKEYYLEYKEELGFQQFVDNTIDNLVNNYGYTREDAIATMTSQSNDGYTFTSLLPEYEYYAVAMGINADGKLNTDVVAEYFKTEAVELSDNTFEITISNPTYNGADYKVVPSNKEDKYFVNLYSKPLVDEMGDEAFLAYCIESNINAGMMDWLCTSGDFELENEEICQPGREYYVVVFGYDSGVATTGLTKKSFETPGGENPENCTFTFETTDIKHDKATVSVTPSDMNNVYIWDIVEKEFYDMMVEGEGMDPQEFMAMNLEEYIGLYAEDFGSIYEAVEMISVYGGYSMDPSGKDSNTISNLSPETEYMAWAVCVGADGTPLADFAMSEPFTTKPEIISTATAAVSVEKYFDGAEVGSPYPSEYAVVPVTVKPSADAAHWLVSIYASDITDSSRANIIRNLEFSGDMDASNPIYTSRWNEVTTVVAIAIDADGNYGNPSFQVNTFTKENASPASEFGKKNVPFSSVSGNKIAPEKSIAEKHSKKGYIERVKRQTARR